MKYYLVKCKFGHVGRDKYLPLYVPIVAESAKEATSYAKRVGGVKKDHKDWCLEVPKEVCFEEYEYYKDEFKNDIYFEKHSRSRLYLFKDRLQDEPNYTRVNGIKTNKKIFVKTRDKEILDFKKRKELARFQPPVKHYYRKIKNNNKKYQTLSVSV